MTPALRRKLDALVERREEVERLLADPVVGADQNRFRTLSREFSTLQPVADALAAEAQARADLAAAEAMRSDAELRERMLASTSAVQHRLGASRFTDASPVERPTISGPKSRHSAIHFSLTSALIGQV